MNKLKRYIESLRDGLIYEGKASIDEIFIGLGYGEKNLVLALWEEETGSVYRYNNKEYEADHSYIRKMNLNNEV